MRGCETAALRVPPAALSAWPSPPGYAPSPANTAAHLRTILRACEANAQRCILVCVKGLHSSFRFGHVYLYIGPVCAGTFKQVLQY